MEILPKSLYSSFLPSFLPSFLIPERVGTERQTDKHLFPLHIKDDKGPQMSLFPVLLGLLLERLPRFLSFKLSTNTDLNFRIEFSKFPRVWRIKVACSAA